MTGGRRRGFTLIELLVVVVIIGLLAALLLPAIIRAICAARQGAAEHLVDNITQALTNYQFDYAVYPAGNGDGSFEVVNRLEKQGPKKVAYFEFQLDAKCGKGVINPVWPVDPSAGTISNENIINYRCNVPAPSGGGGAGMPTLRNTKSFDMWCAGCNYYGGGPTAAWEVNNWE
jgi:prepilin-type N-terminal cleavage/methylation domain-containing protein